MSRVCVIRCHYFRDTRLQREVSALLDQGHEVQVLCLRDSGEPISQRDGRLRILRVPMSHRAGAGTAGRLVEYSAFLLLAGTALAALHMRRRFHLVQVNSPPDVLVFAAFVPKVAKTPVLLDLQEPMPEFFTWRSMAGKNRWIVRLIEAVEQASIRFADASLTVTEQMRETFLARGACPSALTVVMDGSDSKIFDASRFPRQRRDSSKFVMVSHGTIEPQYGLDTAVRAVALLAPSIPSIQLRIIGDGSQRTELKALSAQLGVADLITFSAGFIPVDELVMTLADSDVGVVAMKRNPFRDLTLASKMFDFITMGVPMAVSTTRSVEETFPSGCFEPFIPDDPADLARAIKRLHDRPELAESYAVRAKEVSQRFSWSVQRERYLAVVETLLDRTSDVCAVLPSDEKGRGSTAPDAAFLVSSSERPDRTKLAEWDHLVRSVAGSDVTQLSAWAEVRETAGFRPTYIFVECGEELHGGALVLRRRLPILGEIGYVPYGPVISAAADRTRVAAALAAALDRLARRKLKALIVQPPLEGGDLRLELERRGFRPSQVEIAPAASFRLDLARPEAELWQAIPKEARRRARQWQQNGVRVRRGTLDDIAILARLHAASAQHHGFRAIPYDYMATLFSRLAPVGHAHLFVGEVQGEPVFADLLTGCGGVLKGRLTGMDRESPAGRLRVSAAVRWEAIKWAKANDYRWFDFGGLNSGAAAAPGVGSGSTALTTSEAFKVSFGGAPVCYPAPVEIIPSPVVRFAYDLSRRWPTGQRLFERVSHRLRTEGFRPQGIPLMRSSGTAPTQRAL